ncbi:hypothetical protein C3L33_23259, partial [Rhododendron williamsianum]
MEHILRAPLLPDVDATVKTWANLLNTFCTSGKLELELIYKAEVQCYEDAKLIKIFPEIVRSLYDQDVLAEDTILHWFCKGTNPKANACKMAGGGRRGVTVPDAFCSRTCHLMAMYG